MKKLLSFIASFSLLLNSFYVPAIAIAQELSPTPEPTPIVVEETTSPTASIEATASPTENPTQEPTTEATISAEPTVSPTETPTENPTQEPQLETQSPVIETPTTTPEIIIETPEAEGVITTEIVENENPFPVTVQNNSWFSLTTDKLDYAPTETAIITGSDFTPNKTYEITISSSDDPATSRTQNITTDSDGKFVFYYQLDGIYRPNYKVEVKDAGFVVAETTFTDSVPTYTYTVDTGGVDDEPGQKDLTRMGVDVTQLPTTLYTTWQWDDTGWSGSNTGDSCNLFDTDGDGNANYAICVTVANDPAVQTATSPRIYACGDSSSEKCTSDSLVTGPYLSSCTVDQQANQPFAAGDDTPNDTNAYCTVQLSEVGGVGTTQLIDSCSFPSQQPNSDPSDCIIASTASQTGTVELKKVWSGTPSQTTLNIGSTASGTEIVSVQTGVDGGTPLTTGTKIVSTGTFYVSEAGGLVNYTSSLSCTKNGQAYTPGSNNSLVVGNSDIFICTFTNTRNTGSVKVNKKVDSGNGFVDANPGSFTWSLDTVGTNAMGSTVSGVNIGSHDVNENTVTDYHFVGWYPTASTQYSCAGPQGTTLPVNVSVSANTTTDITLCNAINTGTIIVHKDIQGPNGEDVTDLASHPQVSLDGATGQLINENFTVTYNNVPIGSHTITESYIDTNYTLYGISSVAGTAGNITGLTINVTTGTNHVYVTNRQQSGTITVVKDVVNPDGGAVSDSHLFTVNLAPGGQSDSFAEGDNAVFTVNPGTYTASENDDINYDELGCLTATGKTDIVVGSGESVTVTCKNQQKKATIDVIKDVLSPTSEVVSDNHAFTAQLNGGNNQSFSETTTASYVVNPGNYSITELSDNNYDYVSCTPDSNQTAGDGAQVTVVSNGSVTVTCTNKQKNAQVTIVKDVRDPNGGDVSDSTNFVVQRDGSDDKDFHEGLNAIYSLAPETYIFTEIVTGGYTLNSISNDNDVDVNNGTTLTLNSGQNVTITFTNYQNSGSILGQKLSDTDGVLGTTNDQSNLINWVIELYACTSNFTDCVLSTSDTTDSSGYSFLNLVPGYYQVSEVLQSGWTVLSSLFQDVTLDPGESDEDNNFVNFENVSVTACKKVDADGNIATIGDQTPAYWEMTLLVDGQTTGGAQFTDRTTGCYTWVDLGPGHTYGISEATPSGWTTLTDTTHSFGTATGGSDYTYTFVNFENASIVVHKNVLNEFGSEVDDSKVFKVEIDGTNTEDISEGNDVTYSDLLPGTYTISELITPEGYEFVSMTNGGSVTVASGQTHDVYVVNKQLPGSITIVKDALPNAAFNFGFTGDLGSFTLDDDANPTYPNTTTFSNLGAGIYSITENSSTTWTLTNIVCVDSDQGTVVDIASRNATIDLDFGENITCTFTNSRRPKINIIKHVINDNGGTKVASDFTVNVTGENPSETTFLGSESGTWVYFDPGSYSIDEIEQTGYTKSLSVNCSGTLSYGNSRTCTIINDDQPGQIEIIKNTIGGDGTFDFNIGGPSASTPSISTLNNSGDTDLIAVDAGSYSITETEQSGWDLTNSSCDSGTPDGFSIANGETVTCTFENTQRGSIAGRKYNDTNGNGSRGGSEPYLDGWMIHVFDAEWTEISQMQTGDDTTVAGPVDLGQYKFTNLTPATYFVCEDLQSGWSQSQPSSGEMRNSTYCRTVTVDPGQSVTSQHFGNIELGVIQSRKYEDVNGDSVRSDDESWLDGWTIRLYKQGEGWEPIDSKVTGDTGTEGQYRFEDLSFGTYYICEVLQDNWAQTDPSSSEGYANLSGATDEAGRCRRFIVDSSGDESIGEKHFGNQGQGTIVINKDVDPNAETTFDFSIIGTLIETIGFTLGDDGSTSYILPEGSYTLAEDTNSSYTTSVDCISDQDDTEIAGELNLNRGETIICSFTNTRNIGDIIVHKIIDVDGNTETTNDQTDGGSWEFNIDNVLQSTDQDGVTTFYDLETGIYNVSEVEQDGYDFVTAYCDSGNDDGSTVYSVNVNKDTTTNCTFINTPNGRIHGQKWNDLDGDGLKNGEEEYLSGWKIFIDENDNQTWDDGEKFMLTDDGQEFGWYWFDHLLPGTYDICEVSQDGWQQTYPSSVCHSIDVNVLDGETNTCTVSRELNSNDGGGYKCNFGNREDDPSITITKSNDKSGGASINDEVTYTLVVTNTGNLNLSDLKIKDAFPGGFVYVAGSSYLDGVLISDPNISGGLLTWNIGDLDKDKEIELSYKLKINDNVVKGGSYKNFATCSAFYGSLQTEELSFLTRISLISRKEIECNIADSSVNIGQSNSYGGNLYGQVLGASTELPATGNPTWILAFALSGLIAGLFLKKKYAKN